jgi:predicted anti-sigma-YlaC factor YlaD
VTAFGGRPPGSGPHLEDALSAYLDDELAPAARREAEAHLAGCTECRDELDDVAAARQAIRILPVHATPRALLDGPPVQAVASRRRAVWAAAAAVAAAIALVLPLEPEVAPSLPSLAGSHAARASLTGDPLQLAPIAVPVRFGP